MLNSVGACQHAQFWRMRSLDLMATQGRINQADISARNQQLETNRALVGKVVYSLFDVNDTELLIFVSCCIC